MGSLGQGERIGVRRLLDSCSWSQAQLRQGESSSAAGGVDVESRGEDGRSIGLALERLSVFDGRDFEQKP
jgi:hypothetical protein